MRTILMTAHILCPYCHMNGPLGLGVVCCGFPLQLIGGSATEEEHVCPSGLGSLMGIDTHGAEIFAYSSFNS